MTNGKRMTGIFGIAGVLVAALIISAFVVGSNIIQAQAKGMLTIQVTDKPVELSSLYVTVDWVRIQSEDNGWVDLALELSDPFNLLELQNGVSATLSQGKIPVGSYSMIEMHVQNARATISGESQSVDLNVPSDVIKVLLQPHLSIKEDAEATVVIDLQPNDANTIAISHSLNLRPVIRAMVS